MSSRNDVVQEFGTACAVATYSQGEISLDASEYDSVYARWQRYLTACARRTWWRVLLGRWTDPDAVIDLTQRSGSEATILVSDIAAMYRTSREQRRIQREIRLAFKAEALEDGMPDED